MNLLNQHGTTPDDPHPSPSFYEFYFHSINTIWKDLTVFVLSIPFAFKIVCFKNTVTPSVINRTINMSYTNLKIVQITFLNFTMVNAAVTYIWSLFWDHYICTSGITQLMQKAKNEPNYLH